MDHNVFLEEQPEACPKFLAPRCGAFTPSTQTGSIWGQMYLNIYRYQILIQTKFSYIPNSPTYQILLHTKFSYIPNSHTYQILLHTKFSYIQNSQTYQILIHTKFSYIQNSHTYQILIHTKLANYHTLLTIKFLALLVWNIKKNTGKHSRHKIIP